MPDLIKLEDQYYIRATSPIVDDRRRVLKWDDLLAIFDRYGDIEPVGLGSYGLYFHDTRFISRFALRLEGARLQLLGSTIREQDRVLVVDLANADITVSGNVKVRRETVHVLRTKFLYHDACYEKLTFSNHGLTPIDLSFSFRLDADFVDMFEIRGTKRHRFGERLPVELEPHGVVFSYRGIDGVLRRTRITSTPQPDQVEPSELSFKICLGPKDHHDFYITLACGSSRPTPAVYAYEQARSELRASTEAAKSRACTISTTNFDVNRWLNRSTADLDMMLTSMPTGPYPYAGVPWFDAPFGRDGIITALECLWMNPWIARGVLAYLASTQALESNPESDAEPGKILHESRSGEMAAVGEVPFARYYGSVDATPLFVFLASEYYRRSGDLAFIKSLQPHVELAIQWIDHYGDCDQDGFVEYKRKSANGLEQQGWKDSSDSVFYADGALVEGPVALCEVQAYVFGAKRGAADLARALGQDARAEELAREAQNLQRQFEEVFWSDELGTYVLALDGKKRPCSVRASNAGHCLYIGIASPEHATRLADTLMAEDFFSGWGIRTLSSRELRYNPISYHNGSVWPHDNALIASGLARYGFRELAFRVAAALFDVSRFVNLQRLPELFCGFDRQLNDGPTLYPVACAPQSWAIASAFLIVQACLGISVSPLESPAIRFNRPAVPKGIEYLDINNLSVGEQNVSLRLRPTRDGLSAELERQTGSVEVAIHPRAGTADIG